MIEQNEITSKFKNVALAIFVTFCWVTSASASLLTYDITGDILFLADPEVSLDVFEYSSYSGTVYIDPTAHTSDGVSVEGLDPVSSRYYSLTYDIQAIDNQYRFQGEGELCLCVYDDAYLRLYGFANFFSESPSTPVIDGRDRANHFLIWHEPGFELSSLVSWDIRSYGSIVIDGREAEKSLLHMEQVVPIPASVWLFGSGLVGLIGIARRKRV
jgi:hypothetical protein